ncbi:hypothetical protein [Salinisphaera orenii]|uniref:hypothetical protein n=1 Tax=Salinisphaera orenii TaxID=856731 RepID=UPI0013A680A5
MIRLNGTLTALAPITVSYVGMTGLPRTPHQELMLYGGTFRGPLRKACYRALRHHLAGADGDPSNVFSLADAYMLGEGVDVTNRTAAESGAPADPVSERRIRTANPMLDLFGRWKLAGRLAIGSMRTPESNLMTAGRGARTDMFERDNREAMFLAPADRDTLMRQLESERATQREIEQATQQERDLKRRVRNADPAEKQTINNELAALKTRVKELKNAREGATESIKHPLNGFEAIAPGSELPHRVTLIEGTDVNLGLLLMSLVELAREPYLGGYFAQGCGEFEADYSVSRFASGSLKPETIGRVAFGPDGVELDGDILNEAYQSFIDQLSSFDFHMHTLADAKNADA